MPRDFSLQLVGFGYSFSNVGYTVDDGMANSEPYFAVGAVNNKVRVGHNTHSDAVILFKTSPFCINIKEECASTSEMEKIAISKEDAGEHI